MLSRTTRLAVSFALVIGLGGTASANDDLGDIGLLAVLNGNSAALTTNGLGADVDGAVASLGTTAVATTEMTSRNSTSTASLGIGALAKTGGHTYTGVYAAKDTVRKPARLSAANHHRVQARFASITAAVAACYGEGMSAGGGADQVAVAVDVRRGKVRSMRMVDRSAFGDADLDNCLAPVVAKLAFPKRIKGEVQYTWKFEFRAQSHDLN